MLLVLVFSDLVQQSRTDHGCKRMLLVLALSDNSLQEAVVLNHKTSLALPYEPAVDSIDTYRVAVCLK